MAGLGLAGVGAIATVAYSLESTGSLMAALAAAADATSLIMPASACCLWKSKRRLLAAVAWCMWLAATQYHRGQCRRLHRFTHRCFPGRPRSGEHRTRTSTRARCPASRRAWRYQRTAADRYHHRAIQNAHVAELEALRTALAMAKRRDAIDVELAGLEPRLAGLPAVTMPILPPRCSPTFCGCQRTKLICAAFGSQSCSPFH